MNAESTAHSAHRKGTTRTDVNGSIAIGMGADVMSPKTPPPHHSCRLVPIAAAPITNRAARRPLLPE